MLESNTTPSLRRLLALALVTLLTACSGMQTMYRHADIYLEWKANQFFDLDRVQNAAAKPAIDALLKWHRQNELQAYVHMLEAVREKLKTRITLDDIRWFNDEARARTRVVMTRAALIGAPVLATVTPQQIETLKKRLTKENEDFFDKFARGTVEKQQNRRVTRDIENAEYWVGNLTDQQKDKIKQIVAESPPPYTLQIGERQRIQGQFVALLGEKNSAEALKPKLTAWIANWDTGRSVAFNEAAKVSTDQVMRITLSVLDTLTPAQREHTLTMLQDYIDNMKALIADKT